MILSLNGLVSILGSPVTTSILITLHQPFNQPYVHRFPCHIDRFDKLLGNLSNGIEGMRLLVQSLISSIARLPSLAATAASSVLIACAVRPFLPITFPTSCSDTLSVKISLFSFSSKSIFTCSG